MNWTSIPVAGLVDFVIACDVGMLDVAGNRASRISVERLEECRRALRKGMVRVNSFKIPYAL